MDQNTSPTINPDQKSSTEPTPSISQSLQSPPEESVIAPGLNSTPTLPTQLPVTPNTTQPNIVASTISPQPTPAFNPSTQPPTNPGHIVLQWLTYALWGWTVLATSLLVVSVISSLLNDSDSGSFTTYGIAAVLVLLPFSIIADVFFSKVEQAKKQGAASVVMIIHAVLFGIFGIGSLISAVISIIIMITSGGDNSTSLTAFLSSGIIFILYVATFIRTLNPASLALVKRFYIIFMAVVVGLISLLGIVGPVAKERATRDDRLIVENVSSVTSAISGYARTNNKLPSSLSELDVSSDTEALVESGLLTYTPNIPGPSRSNNYYGDESDSLRSGGYSRDKVYYYQICATYKEKSKDRGYGSSYEKDRDYTSYLSVYNHPAGKECYKLSTSNY